VILGAVQSMMVVDGYYTARMENLRGEKIPQFIRAAIDATVSRIR
jgi:hypothetical protein